MKRSRTLWVNAALGVLVLVAGTVAYISIGENSSAQTGTGRTATVRTGNVTATITGTGNLASAALSSLAFGASGKVTEVAVKVGDVVHAGDVLARVDDAAAQANLASAKAALAVEEENYRTTSAGRTSAERQKDQLAISSARLGIQAAQLDLAAARDKLDTDGDAQDAAVAAAQAALDAGKGTQAQLDAAEARRDATLSRDRLAVDQSSQKLAESRNQLASSQETASRNAGTPTSGALASARAALAAKRLAVRQAQSAWEGTMIRAPQGGTVLAVNGRVGDSVGAGSSSTSTGSSGSGASGSSGSGGAAAGGAGSSGSAAGSSGGSSGSGFVVIADLNRFTVAANVAEADIASVEVGQSASVTLSASRTVLNGRVDQISLQSTTSNNVVQYPVTVSVAGASGARLGSSVSLSITTGSKEGVLVAPSSAITTLGTRHTVTVRRAGVDTVVPVQTGLAGDSGTEITSGVAEGDVLVLPTSTGTSLGGGFPRAGFGAGFGAGR